jgi:hypothetical protein
MSERRVAAGLSSPDNSVGLTGLIPFEVLTVAEVKLAPGPGDLRLYLDLPPGRRLDTGRGLTYRVYGGEAGLEMDRHGRIVSVHGATLPLVLRFTPREYPEPPARGEVAVDLTFWYTDGDRVWGQDVQWRVPIRWDAAGGNTIDLRYRLPE